MPRRILARNHRRIAEILAGERAVSASPAAKAVVTAITYSIADVFAQSSTQFNRDRFYEVAGQPALDAPVMRMKEHKGFSHGLAPGEDYDMNCRSCIAERTA